MLVKSRHFQPKELDRFRELQRVSFSILEQMASELTGSETEKEVARELVIRFRQAGASGFFHLPVVLFGDRTALPGNWSIGKFFPKSRKLTSGESVILDAAPLFDGYLVDTSYSFCFGENPQHRNMMQHLAQYRDTVLHAVNSGDTFRQIAQQVARTLSEAGYEPVHGKHPGEVLGHRAVKTPKLPFTLRLQGFDAISLSWFKFKETLANSGLWRSSPLWNTSTNSAHPPQDGLWLVEPHAGMGEVGAKWEEILVIEAGQARWLDDEPPHVRQWAQIQAGQDYRPNMTTC